MKIGTVRRGARPDSHFTAYDTDGRYIGIGPTPEAAVEVAVDRGYDYDPDVIEVVDEPRQRPAKVGPDKDRLTP